MAYRAPLVLYHCTVFLVSELSIFTVWYFVKNNCSTYETRHNIRSHFTLLPTSDRSSTLTCLQSSSSSTSNWYTRLPGMFAHHSPIAPGSGGGGSISLAVQGTKTLQGRQYKALSMWSAIMLPLVMWLDSFPLTFWNLSYRSFATLMKIKLISKKRSPPHQKRGAPRFWQNPPLDLLQK